MPRLRGVQWQTWAVRLVRSQEMSWGGGNMEKRKEFTKQQKKALEAAKKLGDRLEKERREKQRKGQKD